MKYNFIIISKEQGLWEWWKVSLHCRASVSHYITVSLLRHCGVNLSFLSSQPPLLHPMASLSWSVCATPWCWPGNSQTSLAALTSPDTSWITVKSSMECQGSGTRPTSSLSARGPTEWVDMRCAPQRRSRVQLIVSSPRFCLHVSLSPGVWPEGEQEVPVPGASSQHGRCRHPIAAQWYLPVWGVDHRRTRCS